MADLEHDIPNKSDTIFEAGSVSKQFTAAAVLLLAAEGKLSLDDPVRKYVPELPDYGAPLTVRHMLQHTSGLRDWGEVASITGWPRTSRVHTHAHVLDIVSRQKALNFPSGTQYLLQQHRLQPGRGDRVARQRQVVRRVLEGARLRADGHDAHPVARRLHAHRQRPGDRLLAGAGRMAAEHAVRERARQRRTADDRGGPAQVERELHVAEDRRPGVRQAAAGTGEVQRRQAAQLRDGADGRHLQGSARGGPQRLDRRLSRAPDPLSAAAGVGRRPL